MTIKLKASGRWAKPRPGPRRGRGRNDWTLWCSWVNVIANKLHKAHISWTGSTMGQRPGHRKDSINAQTKGQQTEGRTGSLRDAQTQRHINNSIVNTLGTATCDNITTPNGRKTFLLTKINFFPLPLMLPCYNFIDLHKMRLVISWRRHVWPMWRKWGASVRSLRIQDCSS